MFADCCYSGGLGHDARELDGHGFKAASITATTATNTSTNNRTFTHSLVDTLRGSPAADRNGDQFITFDVLLVLPRRRDWLYTGHLEDRNDPIRSRKDSP
jgi:hypothetical protein